MAEVQGLGHSIKRKEDPRFLRGKGNYIDDIVLPGMLYARPVLSPYAHARITAIDSEAALDVPGVVAVLKASDLPTYGRAINSRNSASTDGTRVAPAPPSTARATISIPGDVA